MKSIKKIEERYAAVTPGDWIYDKQAGVIYVKNPYSQGHMIIADIRGWGHLASIFSEDQAEAIQDANATCMTEAKHDVRYLLAKLHKVERQRDNLIKVILSLRKTMQ